MGNIAYIRAELERLRQRAALAAEEIHKGTKPLADPEIEGCSGLRKKEKNSEAQINAMIDEALKEIEELGLAEHAQQEQKKEEGKEVDEVLEDEMMILRRFDTGFNRWLSSLSEVELEKVVRRLMKGHANEESTFQYMECVKSMEGMVRFCSKCRRCGCEKCDYIKCLRYVVRWQKPADWWKRSGQSAVMGGLRFLHGK